MNRTAEYGASVNTCGHDAPRVTMPPRCNECGAYAHDARDPYKVSPRLWWLLEWLTRRHVRRLEPPKLTARVVRASPADHRAGQADPPRYVCEHQASNFTPCPEGCNS
jgi:hypothetical protein